MESRKVSIDCRSFSPKGLRTTPRGDAPTTEESRLWTAQRVARTSSTWQRNVVAQGPQDLFVEHRQAVYFRQHPQGCCSGSESPYEIYTDNADGTTGFMLRLQNGLLMLAELSADGILSAGTYDDSDQNTTVTQILNLL